MEYKEDWKDVPTWEGIFEMSNFGVLRNKITNKIYFGNFDRTTKHYKVTLCYRGREETWLIHRLVATVWQRPLLENEIAHHKNEMPCCNCVWNIQIKSRSKHTSDHHKGHKMSQQTRKKCERVWFKKGQVGTNKGKHFSQEHKKKISESHKGKTSWIKGKHHSEETKMKMRHPHKKKEKTT